MNFFAQITASLSSLAAKSRAPDTLATKDLNFQARSEMDAFTREPTASAQMDRSKSLRSVDALSPQTPLHSGGRKIVAHTPRCECYQSNDAPILNSCTKSTLIQTVASPSNPAKSSAATNALLSACTKFDALDWQGVLQDCYSALKHSPKDQNALMLSAIATVNGPRVGDAKKQGKIIGAGITAAMQTPDERYATLVEFGLTQEREDEGIKRVEKLVKSDPSDRCAYALLLTMHFQRWYWGEHPESLTQAINLADQMQQQWPNDRAAMSVLFYLVGSLGRGNRAAIDFASRHIMPGDDIYHKSVIRPRVIFDYPMHIQRPDLET